MRICEYVLFFVIFTLGKAQDGGILLYPVMDENDGRDVGLTVLCDDGASPEQYQAICSEMQARSSLRLWVYITECVAEDNMILAEDTCLGQAREALTDAGLPENVSHLAAGHHQGGNTIVKELLQFPQLAEVLVLWSSSLMVPLDDVPVPTLSITGDLDAITRITLMAAKYDELETGIQNGNHEYKTMFPIAIPLGLNHISYIEGPMPDHVVDYNIVAEATDEEGRATVNYYTDSFFTYWVNGGEDNQMKSEIEQWYEETDQITQLIRVISMWEEDKAVNRSRYVEEAQRYLAYIPDNEDELKIVNLVVTDDQLTSSKTFFTEDEDGELVLFTATTVYYDAEADHLYQSADMLESKMKSHKAVMMELELLHFEPTPVNCSDVNHWMWEAVWDAMPPLQQQRFVNSEVTVTFGEDTMVLTGPAWVSSPLIYEHCDNNLYVESTGMWTPTEITGSVGGVNYCKLLSPSRALEFMYLDALLESPPSCQL